MLRTGIVGLPNVGKSTLFNAVTRTHTAPAENYPFCTIDRNLGMVTVPDRRVEMLARISGSNHAVPTAIELVDIAGLVEGASHGAGLGNQFLSHIREVDAIVQVVRCFDNDDVVHELGSVDPLRDIGIVNSELLLADLATLENRRASREKKIKGGDKDAARELQLIEKLQPHLDAGNPALTLELEPDQRSILREFFLLTAKPTIFACNVDENELAAALDHPGRHPPVSKVRAYAAEHLGAEAVVVSARLEEELVDLDPSEAAEFLAGMGVHDSGVSALIKAVYHLLGLRTFLTANEKEAHAWTIPAGARAPEAAGAIHTDFQRGFIAAEVIAFDELAALGSKAAAREHGKLRVEGKDYVVEDGDVIEFRFNVS